MAATTESQAQAAGEGSGKPPPAMSYVRLGNSGLKVRLEAVPGSPDRRGWPDRFWEVG